MLTRQQVDAIEAEIRRGPFAIHNGQSVLYDEQKHALALVAMVRGQRTVLEIALSALTHDVDADWRGKVARMIEEVLK